MPGTGGTQRKLLRKGKGKKRSVMIAAVARRPPGTARPGRALPPGPGALASERSDQYDEYDGSAPDAAPIDALRPRVGDGVDASPFTVFCPDADDAEEARVAVEHAIKHRRGDSAFDPYIRKYNAMPHHTLSQRRLRRAYILQDILIFLAVLVPCLWWWGARVAARAERGDNPIFLVVKTVVGIALIMRLR